MKNYDNQQAEIQTIKPRTFTLELSDADVKRLYEKAYSNGITPAQLLEGYIGDLTDGTYSHGSDEREQADSYFNRCCYELMGDNTLLRWALRNYRLEEIADALETYDYAAGDLKYIQEHPGETCDMHTLQTLQNAQNDAESELKTIHEEYIACKGNQPFYEGINAVRQYLNELQSMTERGTV